MRSPSWKLRLTTSSKRDIGLLNNRCCSSSTCSTVDCLQHRHFCCANGVHCGRCDERSSCAGDHSNGISFRICDDNVKILRRTVSIELAASEQQSILLNCIAPHVCVLLRSVGNLRKRKLQFLLLCGVLLISQHCKFSDVHLGFFIFFPVIASNLRLLLKEHTLTLIRTLPDSCDFCSSTSLCTIASNLRERTLLLSRFRLKHCVPVCDAPNGSVDHNAARHCSVDAGRCRGAERSMERTAPRHHTLAQ